MLQEAFANTVSAIRRRPALETMLSVFEHEDIAAAMRAFPERWRAIAMARRRDGSATAGNRALARDRGELSLRTDGPRPRRLDGIRHGRAEFRVEPPGVSAHR